MAQVQLLGRKAQLHLIEEASTGTYLAPAGDGTNMVLIEDGWSYTVNSTNYQPKYARVDYLNMTEVPGACSVEITFRLPLKYSGTAGTAPDFDEVLKACGWEVTNDPGVSDIYAPSSTFDGAGGNPGPSYSCTLLVNGEAYAARNGFAKFVLNATVGEPGFLEVTFMGGYVAPSADALEAVSGYDTTVPPAFMGGAMTIGGATPTGVDAFTLDSGNVIQLITDVNDEFGISGARLVDRRITGTITAEVLASRDDFSIWRAGTTGAFTTGKIGATLNSWNLSVAANSLSTPEMSQVNGILKHTIPFMASSTTAHVEGTNDPATLAFL